MLILLANASDTVVFIEEGLDKGLVVVATGIGKTYSYLIVKKIRSN